MSEHVDVLKLNAAATRLASAIYYAKAEAFGGESRLFEDLDVMIRHAYTERAAELLKTLQPKPTESSPYFELAERLTRTAFATGTRDTLRVHNVIGQISPKEL
jgi:hypothetical protein